MIGYNRRRLNEDLVRTTMRPVTFEPAFDKRRQFRGLKTFLSYHKDLKVFMLREAFEVIRSFCKNKVNYLWDIVVFIVNRLKTLYNSTFFIKAMLVITANNNSIDCDFRGSL